MPCPVHVYFLPRSSSTQSNPGRHRKDLVLKPIECGALHFMCHLSPKHNHAPLLVERARSISAVSAVTTSCLNLQGPKWRVFCITLEFSNSRLLHEFPKFIFLAAKLQPPQGRSLLRKHRTQISWSFLIVLDPDIGAGISLVYRVFCCVLVDWCCLETWYQVSAVTLHPKFSTLEHLLEHLHKVDTVNLVKIHNPIMGFPFDFVVSLCPYRQK